MSLFSCIAYLKEFQNDCHFVTQPLNFGSDNFGSRGFTELLVVVLCWSGWTKTADGGANTGGTWVSTLFLNSSICLWQSILLATISSDSYISLVMSSSGHNEFISSSSSFSVFNLFSSKLLITSRRFRFEALSSCGSNWWVFFSSLETTPLWAALVALSLSSFDIDFANELCPTLGVIISWIKYRKNCFEFGFILTVKCLSQMNQLYTKITW